MFLIMGLCFSLAAFGLLGGAVWAYFKQRRTIESRLGATGTVVELTSRVTASGRANMICPVVEFSVPSGEKFRFTSDFGSLPAMHRVGQSVDVRYEPADPHKAEINSTTNLWLTPLILVFLGLLACCLGATFIVIYAVFPSMFSS